MAGPLGLVACGGGGDAVAHGPQVQGRVVLPSGVQTQDIAIVSNGGEAGVSIDSRFAAPMLDDALGLVSAVHGNARLLSMGLFSATDSDPVLDANSSAAALVFMALGGWNLGPADRATLHRLIVADASTALLGAVVARRQATNAFALDEPDIEIVDAVRAAVAGLRSQVSRAPGSSRAHRLAANDIQPLLRIEPGGEVNGIAVNQDGEVPGFSIQNTKRRHGMAHLYKVAYQLPEAERVDLALAEAVGKPIEIDSTQSLNVYSALADIINSSAPWAPVTTSRTPLPMHPGAEETRYELVQLVPVYDRPEPDFWSEARYGLEREQWRTELGDLFERAQMELVFGALLEALGFGGIAYSSAVYAQALAAMRAAASGDALVLLAQARAGSALLPGFRAWLVSVSSGNAIVTGAYRAGVAALVRVADQQFAANLAAGNMSQLRLAAFQGSVRVMLAVSVVAGVLDTAAQYQDLHSGEESSLFNATLVAPKVLVSPASGKVAKGQQQILTARVTGAQGATLTYRWTLAGSNLANLSDGAGKIGIALDTDSDTVTLATTPSTVGTLVISVEAFQVKAAGNRSLGSASSQMEMDDTQVVLSPAAARIERVGGSQAFAFTITPAPQTPSALAYEWSCPSQFGTLASGGQSTSAAQQTIVSAVATATYMGRDGLDGGESETLRVVAFYSTPDPQTGAVTRIDVASASADVSIKQRFNIEILPLSADVPADASFGVSARLQDPPPAGSKITWTWSSGGVGSIEPVPGDADKANSSVTFHSGASEGHAFISARARVEVPGTPPYVVEVLPVTNTLQVKRGLKTLSLSGGWTIEITVPAPGFSQASAYVVVPKVAGAKSYAVQLTKPTPDAAGGVPFPSARDFSPAALGSWEDRGGAYWSGLSGGGGADPWATTNVVPWLSSRFSDMAVAVTVTL
jgi:hypothetical protein